MAGSVGFVGLGAMGSGMATVLRGAGLPVRAFDVWAPSLERFAAAGGQTAASVAEASAGATHLVLMVVSAEQAEAVIAEAAAGLAEGAVVVLCSTVPPSAAKRMAAQLASMGRGLEFVDAPVSGGVARAAAGSLTIMSSGTEEGCARAARVLAPMTAKTPGALFRINGPPGAGSSVKMVNQLLAGVHIAAAAEAMALGARAGLDTRQLFEVISSAAGSSWMFVNRVPQMLDDDTTPHSALDIFVKDLGIVLSEGTGSRFPLPLAAAAHQQFLAGSAMGLGRQADAMVVKVFPNVSVAAPRATAGGGSAGGGASPPKLPKTETLAGLPAEWNVDALAEIQSAVASKAAPRLVVLDDDPTGTQTVHGIRVLTEWSEATLAAELATDAPGFFILTNTRAMPPAAAHATVSEICTNLQAAAAGEQFSVVLRSDSTLRGHFQPEADAVTSVLGAFDALIVCPFFLAGGRYTIDDVHYVQEGDSLVPAAATEFARDRAFGYSASNLKDYVEEKTGGRVKAGDVRSISLGDIRGGGPGAVCDALLSFPKGAVVVVNAASDADLAVFAAGQLRAEGAGRRFLCRTAASFVSARMAIRPIPPLQPAQLGLLSRRGGPGGLIVVGSYVPKTTAQIKYLVEAWASRMSCINVSAELLSSRDEAVAAAEVARAASAADEAISEGREALICTTRELLTGECASSSLELGNRISARLIAIVRAICTRPRFLLAKGGITSSDMATAAMEAKSATVLGQAAPGVPLWALGPGSRYEGMPYVVFPGNVGTQAAVAEVVARLAIPARPTTASIMAAAAAGRYAVGAFNVYDLVGASAVVAAAEECGSSVMLQIHPAALRSPVGGAALAAGCLALAKRAAVDVTLHLDHALAEQWEDALRLGFDSVLVDGSNLSYEDNLALTARAVEVCHARGLAVEAEIGRLSGTEDGLTVAEVEAKMTDPTQAAQFVAATGVDLLAVCIGNVHGRYPPSGPQLDLDRLRRIRAAVPPHVGLVLHGASGVPAHLVRECIALGVVKFNVNTEVRAAYLDAIRDPAAASLDLAQLQEAAQARMAEVVRDKLALFGSAAPT